MLKHRSIYRVKREFLPILEDLSGFEISPSELPDYIYIQVNKYHTPIKKSFVYGGLPQSSDSQLVHTLLKQLERNYLSIANVKLLRQYLQLSKMQDDNNKIKPSLMAAIKRIVIGLLILGGGVGGLLITLFFIPVISVKFATFASLMLISLTLAPLMLIPLTLFALAVVGGAINSLIGLVELSMGIFSVCFRPNNIAELTLIKDKLAQIIDQKSPQPFSNYQDLFENTSVSMAKSLSLTPPPPYHQNVVHNSTVLPTEPVSLSPVYTSRSLVSNPAQFFYFPMPGAAVTTNAAVPAYLKM